MRLAIPGLRGRFLAISLSLVAAGSTLLLGAQELYLHRSAHRELGARVLRTARVQADLLALPLWNLDGAGIDQVLAAAVRDRDIVSATLFDSRGTVLATTAAPGGQQGMASQQEPVTHTSGGETFRLGLLRLEYTSRQLDAVLWRRLLLASGLLAALLLTTLAGVLYADRRVLRTPVARLTQSIVRGRDSGLREPVTWTADDELGTLIHEYNRMLREEAAAQEDSRRKTALLEATLESIHQGLCVFDTELRLLAYNRRYLELVGDEESPPEIGTRMGDLVRRRHARGEYGSTPVEALVADREAMAQTGRPYRYSRVCADGRSLEIQTTPMAGGGMVSTYTDVTERREFEARLHEMALYDALTGLPNRSLLLDRLRQAMASARRKKRQVAVHFLDLDRFKDINDTLGHAEGDRLLRQLGTELAASVRETDTAARLGGDEFAIVQGDIDELHETENLAHRVLEVLARPVELDGRKFQISASIGITLFPEDADTAEDLLRNADLAMYAAKASGRGRYRYFVPTMDEQLRQRRRLEDELRVALEADQLVLHYQPVVETSTLRVTSAEALVRWQHPELGLLAPDVFIPVAEECGLIDDLALWVLRSVCRLLATWRDEALPSGFRIATNVSAGYLHRGDLELDLRQVLADAAISPGTLGIEITESTIMEDPDAAARSLASLRALGIEISIDDFGTGYSSLSYLKRLPLDAIKIDRSFVHELDRSDDDKAIVRSMIQLAHGLGLSVVAEGVEEERQAAWLAREGCDSIQGFLYARPMPAAELREWLRRPLGR